LRRGGTTGAVRRESRPQRASRGVSAAIDSEIRLAETGTGVLSSELWSEHGHPQLFEGFRRRDSGASADLNKPSAPCNVAETRTRSAGMRHREDAHIVVVEQHGGRNQNTRAFIRPVKDK
jgi:hypothetical protein